MNEKISCVKLSDGNIYSFFDKQGVHWEFRDGKGFILITGDPVVDGEILNKNLHIVECNNESIENLLTYEGGQINTRDIDTIYEKDLGGNIKQYNSGSSPVSADGVLEFNVPRVKS